MGGTSLIFSTLFLLGVLSICQASIGDRSPFYQKCTNKCMTLNCTDDGDFQNEEHAQPFYLKILLWSCDDECRYDCMWSTVHSFMLRSWEVPQFYGKWPFVRVLGIQEPASVIFSLMNLCSHVAMLRRFRREVRQQSPLYWLWHLYAAVCVNAWFWSAVFHTRDSYFTELMDYFCAFSMVLFSCYSMFVRFLYNTSSILIGILSLVCFAIFSNHVSYLYYVQFDYGYNMQANIIVGLVNALGWLGWCNWKRKTQPYCWRCVVFVLLAGFCMLFEVADFAPLLWVVDAHSLWHLGTSILPYFFYRFLIDDCKYLKKQQDLDDSGKAEKQKSV